ncbi:MAG: GNAT family N-acetyltransferase [Xanthobacteraceae bacterium]
MTVILRHAAEADAKNVASLLTELGYPSVEANARDRLVRSLRSATSCVVVAEADGEVIGTINAELVPYFPNGSTICRVTALVVSSHHRSRGVGEKLLARIAEFAREHGCSGIEVTSSQRRVAAHRFYERLGFSKNSFRFFRAL